MNRVQPLKFTLDTNCLVDLEDGRPGGPYVRQLADAHKAGAACVALVFSSASENPRFPKSEATTVAEFQRRAADLDLSHLEILPAQLIFDFSFWDACLWPSPEGIDLEESIQSILSPSIPSDYAAYCKAAGLPAGPPIERRWRNAKCDAQAIWAHIHHGFDVFVTSDREFHKEAKHAALIKLGAGRIAIPADAPGLLARNDAAFP